MIEDSHSYNRPYSTDTMNFGNVEWIVNFIPLNYTFGVIVYYWPNTSNDASSPKLNIAARCGDTNHTSQHSIAKLMNIIMIHQFPLVNHRFLHKGILILCYDSNDQPWWSRWYDSIHDDLVGFQSIFCDSHGRSCIHEKCRNQYYKCACN